MGKHPHDHCCDIKIEAGQILNPECFPLPNELVCIQVPKVFDQVALRDCVERQITLTPGPCTQNPIYNFEGASDFEIVDIRVIQKSDSMTRLGYKKLKIAVRVRYNIFYSDGHHSGLKIQDEATFTLTVNEIYCPDCVAQIGVIRYPENLSVQDKDGTLIKVEALVEVFGDAINGNQLIYDVGGFFIVKCECEVQLLIPAYGYCPVPPEQSINPATQTCVTFNDKCRTPFPTQFFPDQKWNPLDRAKKDDWDD